MAVTNADAELRLMPGYIHGLYQLSVTPDLPVGTRRRAVGQFPKLVENNWFLFKSDEEAAESDDPNLRISRKFLKITAAEKTDIAQSIIPAILNESDSIVRNNLLYALRIIARRLLPEKPQILMQPTWEALDQASSIEMLAHVIALLREMIVGLCGSISDGHMKALRTLFPQIMDRIGQHLDEIINQVSNGGEFSTESLLVMYSCLKMAAKVLRFQLTKEFDSIPKLRVWVHRALAITSLQTPEDVCIAVATHGMAAYTQDKLAGALFKAQKWSLKFLRRLIKRVKGVHEAKVKPYHDKINTEFGVPIAQQVIEVIDRGYATHMHMLLPSTLPLPENPFFFLPTTQIELLELLSKLVTLAAPYKSVIKSHIEIIIKGFLVYCCRVTQEQLELWESEPQEFTAQYVALVQSDTVEYYAAELVRNFVKQRTTAALPVIQSAIEDVCNTYAEFLQTSEYQALVQAAAAGEDLPEELLSARDRYMELSIQKAAITRILSYLRKPFMASYNVIWELYQAHYQHDAEAPRICAIQLPRLASLEFIYAFIAPKSNAHKMHPQLLEQVTQAVLHNLKNDDMVISAAAARALNSLLERSEALPLIEAELNDIFSILTNIVSHVKSTVLAYTLRQLMKSFPQHIKPHAVSLANTFLEFFRATLLAASESDDEQVTEDEIWVSREYGNALIDLHLIVHDDPELRYGIEEAWMPTIVDAFTPPEKDENGYYLESKEELLQEVLPWIKQMVHEVDQIYPHAWEIMAPMIQCTMEGELYAQADEVSSILLDYIDHFTVMFRHVPDSIENLTALYTHFLADNVSADDEKVDGDYEEGQSDVTSKIWITNVIQKLAGYLSPDPSLLEGLESPEAGAARILNVTLQVMQTTLDALNRTRVPEFATALIQVMSQLLSVNPIYTVQLLDQMGAIKNYIQKVILAVRGDHLKLTDDIRGIALSMSTLLMLLQERGEEMPKDLHDAEVDIYNLMMHTMSMLAERNEWVYDSDAESEDDEDEDEDALFLDVDENEDVSENTQDNDDVPLVQLVKNKVETTFSDVDPTWADPTPASCGVNPVRFIDIGERFMKAAEFALSRGHQAPENFEALREFASQASEGLAEYVHRKRRS